MRSCRAFLLLMVVAAPWALPAQQPADASARLDQIFAPLNAKDTPGCAVGVARDGQIVLTRAYGMADLEQDVPNSPDTIFEAGSVAKQVTAGAIMLLAEQGKLSLDDDVRQYVPEVPDYGTPITIRHLLTHTSGLRDWRNLAAIAGWPPGSRVHTQAHMLDIVSRQRALNFQPGEEYSYSNTGYNLLALVVARVSGTPFAEFCKKNIFEPLGMMHTQWRDDFKRVVKGRAVAYHALGEGQFEMHMPFENVYGNAGLLTTVGDLLLWTENLESGKLGGPAFIKAMHRQGRLNNGRMLSYAAGLVVTKYKDIPEVSHAGTTTGYRAFLARYPKQHLAVALLCNFDGVNPERVAHHVADVFLGPAEPIPVSLSAEELHARAGLYRNTVSGEALRLVVRDGALRLHEGPALIPLSTSLFRVADSEQRLAFEASPGNTRQQIRIRRSPDQEVIYAPIPDFTPSGSQLAAYAGEYYNAEVETSLTAAMQDGKLVLRRRPATRIPLTPVYADAFDSSLGLIRFLRDRQGKVTRLSIRDDRVYDLRFERVRK